MGSSSSEKLRIASHFLLQSPPGQVDQVLRDVRILLGSDASALTRPQLDAALSQYNQAQFVFAPAPDAPNENVMCCPQAQADTGSKDRDVYANPNNHQLLKFDNVNRTWSSEKGRAKSAPPAIEEYRVAIQDAVHKYAASVYLDESKYAIGVFATATGDVSVVLSAKNIALHNFWAGSWRTVFTLNVSKPGARSPIGAHIRVNVHYFEDGNVQLNTEFKRSESIQIGDPAATASAVHAAMDTIETEFQTSLEEFYVDMHKQTFAGMRRFLPVTRTPMDWNPNAHKLAAQLKN
ncbi:F-actin-capping protein subunit alpha [Plasmodiophora brassicae]